MNTMLSGTLNTLASNNIIGYDVYANTLGCNKYYTNPYGVSRFNTGVARDSYTSSKITTKKALGAGILGATALIVASNTVTGCKKASKYVKRKTSKLKKTAIGKFLNKCKKSIKKLPKGLKVATAVAAVGVIAAKVLNTVAKTKNQPQ